MQKSSYLRGASRHRTSAVLWRVGGAAAAAYTWHYGYGEILAALIVMGTGLVATTHDLVAASLLTALRASPSIYRVTLR